MQSASLDAGDMHDAAPIADAAHPDVQEDPGTDPDAGDAGASDPPVICGDQLCEPHQPSLLERVLAAGCALAGDGAEVCGLASPDAGPSFDASIPAFLPRDAPGTASMSCGAFLESQLEQTADAGLGVGDVGSPNGRVDVRRTVMPDGLPFEIRYVYPGCCTELGFCGLDSRNALAIQMFGGLPYNAGYGCVDPALLFAAPTLRSAPCDPQSGLLMQPPDAGMDAGRDAGPSDAGADAADAPNGEG